MKWTKQWIMKQDGFIFDFSENIKFDKEAMKILKVRDLKDILVSGEGQLVQNQLLVDLNVKGTMILECALTLEDVEYPFHIKTSEMFSFIKVKDNEDIHEVKKDLVDITSIIFQHIMLEVPSRVIKEGAEPIHTGNGWKVINEDENIKKDLIDPRLAKLSNYFRDKE